MVRGGRLRNREVGLYMEVTLPDGRPDRTPPKWQRGRWGVALAALERHEATHRANARAAAEEARSRILDIGVQPDCKSVRNMANRRLRRTVLKYEFRDRRYDARTQIGRASCRERVCQYGEISGGAVSLKKKKKNKKQ